MAKRFNSERDWIFNLSISELGDIGSESPTQRIDFS